MEERAVARREWAPRAGISERLMMTASARLERGALGPHGCRASQMASASARMQSFRRCNLKPAKAASMAAAVPDQPAGPVLAQIAKRHLGSRKSFYGNDLEAVSQMAQIVSQKDLQSAEE